MKRLILFTFIFAIIGLSGCSNKNIKKYNYYFEGETEEWKASMPYYAKEEFYTDKYGTYAREEKVDSDLTVTYIGDKEELSNIKRVEISCEIGFGKDVRTSYFEDGDVPEELSFTLYDVAGDYPLLNKEDVIQVIINLDGEIQTIELSDD